MPELGFGAITEELKILNDDSPASEASSPAPETEPALEPTSEIVPSETQAETTAPELEQPSELAAQQTQDDELVAQITKAYPQYAGKFAAARKQLKEFEQTFGSVKGAREFLSQVQSIGGLEKIKELRTRTEQVKSVDRVYYGGDVEQKRQLFSNIYQQNPQAFVSAVTNGLSLLTPEERSYIMGPHMAEQLRADNTWQWLEYIHNELQGKPELAEVAKWLNQFAGIFRKYGLGPAQSGAPEIAQRRSEFHAEIGRAAGDSLEPDIMRAIDHFLPHVPPDKRDALVDQVHLELQNAMMNDRHLKYALANLSHAGISKAVGNRAKDLLILKLRPHIPYAVQKFAGQFPPPIAPLATNGKAAPSRNGTRKPKLTQREANQMTFAEIITDAREGEARQ